MKNITRAIETYEVSYAGKTVVCTSTKGLNKLTKNLKSVGIDFEVETIENLYSLPIDLFIEACERFAALKELETGLEKGEVE